MRSPPPHVPGSYLVVETTNKCSLACVHCSVSEAGHPHHRQVGYLDPTLIQSLFDDLARVGARFDTLILFWLGEPLIHPHFDRIYQGALRANAQRRVFGKIECHTNATHLSVRNTRVALNRSEVPQVWHFSLDAARRETYHRIKGMDRFEKVERNIARFIYEKGRTGARWPRPVFQYIVSDNNSDEAAMFLRRWTRCCERAGVPVRAAAQNVPPGDDAVVFFRQLDCPTAAEQARQNRVFRETAASLGLTLLRDHKAPVQVQAKNLAPCAGFWASPTVGWNGDVTMCTRDNRHEIRVGNLRDAPFSELWWGPEMAARRAHVERGDYGGLALCQTCFIPRSSNSTDLDADAVARTRDWHAAQRDPVKEAV